MNFEELKVGQPLKFDDEKIFRWTIKSIGLPYVICTTAGPLGYYTILNVEKGIRGPDNFGGVGYQTPKDCESALIGLLSGELEISNRHKIPLVISEVR